MWVKAKHSSLWHLCENDDLWAARTICGEPVKRGSIYDKFPSGDRCSHCTEKSAKAAFEKIGELSEADYLSLPEGVLPR